MLNNSAPYPHPGSTAFLKPSGQACRILQRRHDGRVLISLNRVSLHDPDIAVRASGNRTVEASELAKSPSAAAPKRGRKAKS